MYKIHRKWNTETKSINYFLWNDFICGTVVSPRIMCSETDQQTHSDLQLFPHFYILFPLKKGIRRPCYHLNFRNANRNFFPTLTEESKFGVNDSEKETTTVSTLFLSQKENENETSPTPTAANLIKSVDKSSVPPSVSRSGKSSNCREKIFCKAHHTFQLYESSENGLMALLNMRRL